MTIYIEKLSSYTNPQNLISSLPKGSRFLLESTLISEEQRWAILGYKPSSCFHSCDDLSIRPDHNQNFELSSPDIVIENFPFIGGIIGCISYEAAAHFEKIPTHDNKLDFPDFIFYKVDNFYIFDLVKKEIFAFANHKDILVELALYLEKSGFKSSNIQTDTEGPAFILDEQTAQEYSDFSKDQYLHTIQSIKEYIADGHSYQVNLSQRFSITNKADPLLIYKRLSQISPVHFAGFFEYADFTILSASPERLFQIKNNIIVTRPIAGTRRIGTQEEIERFSSELLSDAKELAEHAMLVDLARNDLGKLCNYGSVYVKKFMEIVQYSTVIHNESEIQGNLAKDIQFKDVFAAIFPGGTITGVPKVRTMELIHELEPCARAIYTGALGYISKCGTSDFNIMIRSILCKRDKAYTSAGGGITYDAIPHREYQETLSKARPQIEAILKANKELAKKRVLIIDNFDSFTFNLVQQFGGLNCDVLVLKNDDLDFARIDYFNPSHLVISPGPGNPSHAGSSQKMIEHFAYKIPILGVCLGLQVMGTMHGCRVVRALEPVHGRVSKILHDNKGIFQGIPNDVEMARYHSLVLAEDIWPEDLLEVSARTEDRQIMAIRHRIIPHFEGVQFHPESFLSKHGTQLMRNFLDYAV